MSDSTASLKLAAKNDDLTFSWLTQCYGEKWEAWRQFAEEWLSPQTDGLHNKLTGLRLFLEVYLANNHSYAQDVEQFFQGNGEHIASAEDLKSVVLEQTRRNNNSALIGAINHVHVFLAWLIKTHFSEVNEQGVRTARFRNPIKKLAQKRVILETVHNALPYRYIKDLRRILCPKPNGHFSDWHWAHEVSSLHSGGLWITVEPKVIDKNDPDCVWRKTEICLGRHYETRYKIWSPVEMVALYLKLHLPLRTYQIRMLDSGEADTWRYEQGQWIENKRHPFVKGSLSKPFAKGIFRRYLDPDFTHESTGFYISTNKTADQNKDDTERGYEIPWQNEEVLYWLEKLRNWQEKYNPIEKPVDCRELELKHTKNKKSQAQLASMGHCCFLFRHAGAKQTKDTIKPIQDVELSRYWYKLLEKLESNLAQKNDESVTNKSVQLVEHYQDGYKQARFKTHFPLHSLRVSLITSYALDAKIPIPIVAKLLAGHSRLIMTIYYTKLTPSMMNAQMTEANQRLDEKAQEGLKSFLQDAELRQIECKTVYQDNESLEAALVNRNPLGWEQRHQGLCLVGGNNVIANDVTSSASGCWNGGEMIKKAVAVGNRVYGPVAHGPENCVRCRWFVTDARYLPALNAHLNFMGYRTSECAQLAEELNSQIQALELEKNESNSTGIPFTKQHQLQALLRRYEKQIVEADEYTKDWIATFRLISRLIKVENQREDSDQTNKLVAVGRLDEIKLGMLETDSELLQLALICDDAEFYPDLKDELKKTPAIQQRTIKLTQLLTKAGYQPFLLNLDTDQQLMVSNALLRQIATLKGIDNRTEGLRQVVNYLELEEFFKDAELLDNSLSNFQSKVPLKQLIAKKAKRGKNNG